MMGLDRVSACLSRCSPLDAHDLLKGVGELGVRRGRRGHPAEYQEQAGTGKFTAVFLIQCLEAIGTSSLRRSDV